MPTFKSSLQTVLRFLKNFLFLPPQVQLLPCLFKSALLFVLNQPKPLLKTADFNYIYLLWSHYIAMSIHVHLYREQSAVTLIQCMQHSKSRLCAETIASRSWNVPFRHDVPFFIFLAPPPPHTHTTAIQCDHTEHHCVWERQGQYYKTVQFNHLNSHTLLAHRDQKSHSEAHKLIVSAATRLLLIDTESLHYISQQWGGLIAVF